SYTESEAWRLHARRLVDSTTSDRTRLRDLVFRHKVVFEIRPPGCQRCVAVWDDLCEIATAVLPPEDRPTGYHVEPFDRSLHYFTKRRPSPTRDRPDVELNIEVRHREGFNREVDPCESRCVQEIIAELRDLGVQEGTWNEHRA